MPTDFASVFLLFLASAVTFTVARLLSRRFRARRKQKEETQRRAGESRQVRRARARRGK
ncbi:MAG: hypothetical protein JWP41_1766 [Ramlibacter sp.]|jgi:positive regulator of sigma E activity|nr:hypothetical protein [Ramlibacter sp.]